jgi:hypothetical protein
MNIEEKRKLVEDEVIRNFDIFLHDGSNPWSVKDIMISEREHVITIGTSILCTKWKIGYPGGSFVQAIVDNNLSESFGRADTANRDIILFYCKLIYNATYPEKLI